VIALLVSKEIWLGVLVLAKATLAGAISLILGGSFEVNMVFFLVSLGVVGLGWWVLNPLVTFVSILSRVAYKALLFFIGVGGLNLEGVLSLLLLSLSR
jgi:hypothetical protein